jgi:general secretion pathway protein D
VLGSGVFVRAPHGTRTHTVAAGSGFQLNFVNTDIKTVVTAVLTQGLGLPVVVDPAVSGTMSLQADQPLSASQVMASLELALRSKGFVLVKVSGVFHVMPAKHAVRHIHSIKMSGKLHPGFGVYVVPLKFVSAQKMAALIRPFAPEGGIVRVDSARNLLLLSGTDQEIAALTGMIKMFDVDWLSGMSFALYPVRYTNTHTLAGELSKVFSGPDSPIEGMVRFVPLKSINSLLIVTPQPKYLSLVESWIKRFDVGSMTPGRRLYVYDVQNGRASDLARSLEEIFSLPLTYASRSHRSSSAQGPSGPTNFTESGYSMGLGSSSSVQGLTSMSPSPPPGTLGNASFGVLRREDRGRSTSSIGSAGGAGSSGGLKIVPDSNNNSLLIYATATEFRMIRTALKRLDVLPLEVVIDASIVEVTLNDGLQYGLNFSYQSSHGPITFSNASSGAVAQQFPGLSFLYSGGTNITAVLNALESITNVRVLSSPKLVVLNNHEAELEVGDEVPIVTQSSVSTVAANAPIVNSVQMLNTGVILQVVPRANESGQVLLNISQEVSDVVPTTTSNIDSPTVEQRQISTTVAVHNGDTIVLGGLIQDSKSVTRSGLPYLRRLPVIGNLFGSTNKNDTRTELIVLLTPHVVRSAEHVDAVMDDLRAQFGALRSLMPK